MRQCVNTSVVDLHMKTQAALELAQIASRTLAHYSRNADAFREGTWGHDVSQNYAAMFDALGGRPALRILDFGCGPGRDLVALHALGHAPVGLEGCKEFVEHARARSGCEVIHQNFFELALGERQFDAVFANAALFHVPRVLLSQVLAELQRVLVPKGVLFCSNPRAFTVEQEGWQGERYGCYLTVEGWRELISAAGFVRELEYLRPAGRPVAEQPWIAMVWRKS
jgi:SAM-dependent methyltransferase